MGRFIDRGFEAFELRMLQAVCTCILGIKTWKIDVRRGATQDLQLGRMEEEHEAKLDQIVPPVLARMVGLFLVSRERPLKVQTPG